MDSAAVRSDNQLLGLAGQDRLSGGHGNDHIDGGADPGDDVIDSDAGNDWMFGGCSADTFVFAAGDGTDRIRDFHSGRDRLDLSQTGLAFEELTLGATQWGQVRISYGEDMIILQGFLATVTEADFIF